MGMRIVVDGRECEFWGPTDVSTVVRERHKTYASEDGETGIGQQQI